MSRYLHLAPGLHGRRLRVAFSALAFALCLAFAFSLTPPSATAAVWAPCLDTIDQIECASYRLPIDRTGLVAGETTVRAVKVEATEGPRLGTLFVIAGGPGQPSDVMLDFMLTLFPGANRYDVVAVDLRGTGLSEPLNCPRIESGVGTDGANPSLDKPITQCADALGPARWGYDSVESIADLEVVRADLGVDQVSIFGVSYGTKMALAYAQRHPSRVRSLLLDSVLPVNEPSAFDLTSVAAMRTALENLCAAGRCKNVLSAPVSKLARLAATLKKTPIEGFIVNKKGKPIKVQITAENLFDLMFAADFNLYVYEQLPAAIDAALRADAQPMIRLFALLSGAADGDAAVRPFSRAAARSGWRSKQRAKTRAKQRRSRGRTQTKPRLSEVAIFSNTLNLTTTCEDLISPWTRDTPVGSRQVAINAAADALPDSQFYPFARATVKNNSLASICRGWQQSPDVPVLPAGPLPDVPTLALNGALDVRTPTTWARSATAGDPRAQVVEVPHTGHSTIGTDVSGCALSLAKRFLIFNGTDGKCTRNPKPVPIAGRAVQSVASIKPLPGTCRKLRSRRCRGAKKAVTAGYLAFRDALDQFVVGGMIEGVGLYGGSWEFDDEFDEDLLEEFEFDEPLPMSLDLLGMEQVPGVFVDGGVAVENYPRVSGSFTVFDVGGSSYRVSISGRMAYDLKDDRVRLTARSGRSRITLIRRARQSSTATVSAATLRLRSGFARSVGSRQFVR
ncbi:MAG: alpha/beta hydrolase [Solirubrobacterales bacterium]